MGVSIYNVIVMQRMRLLAAVVVVLFALPVASVWAAGYQVSVPILGTSGAPALASPSLFSGVLTMIYADGAPVLLASNKVTLSICSATCANVDASLKQTSPGTYAYTFTPPSLSGTVTIYVKAGSLADDNGRIFPSVDTQVGTYASPSLTSSSAQPAVQPLPGSPVSPESNQLTRQAVPESATKQQAPVMQVVSALVILSLVAVGLLIVPTRRKQN
jgi:FlaG/FlaF family flagellin (archaellin)